MITSYSYDFTLKPRLISRLRHPGKFPKFQTISAHGYVYISPQDIAEGRACDCRKCPGAIALYRLFRHYGAHEVSVSNSRATVAWSSMGDSSDLDNIIDPEPGQRATLLFDRAFTEFISNVDGIGHGTPKPGWYGFRVDEVWQSNVF